MARGGATAGGNKRWNPCSIVKSAIGLLRFHLRGIENVAAEWLLIALADNCKRTARLKEA